MLWFCTVTGSPHGVISMSRFGMRFAVLGCACQRCNLFPALLGQLIWRLQFGKSIGNPSWAVSESLPVMHIVPIHSGCHVVLSPIIFVVERTSKHFPRMNFGLMETYPRWSMYDIFTNIYPIYIYICIYPKCRQIYHTWSLWLWKHHSSSETFHGWLMSAMAHAARQRPKIAATIKMSVPIQEARWNSRYQLSAMCNIYQYIYII